MGITPYVRGKLVGEFVKLKTLYKKFLFNGLSLGKLKSRKSIGNIIHFSN